MPLQTIGRINKRDKQWSFSLIISLFFIFLLIPVVVFIVSQKNSKIGELRSMAVYVNTCYNTYHGSCVPNSYTCATDYGIVDCSSVRLGTKCGVSCFAPTRTPTPTPVNREKLNDGDYCSTSTTAWYSCKNCQRGYFKEGNKLRCSWSGMNATPIPGEPAVESPNLSTGQCCSLSAAKQHWWHCDHCPSGTFTSSSCNFGYMCAR